MGLRKLAELEASYDGPIPEAARKAAMREPDDEDTGDMETPWPRTCHRCGSTTTDWEVVNDLGLRCLCWRCYRAYRDTLEEKGS